MQQLPVKLHHNHYYHERSRKIEGSEGTKEREGGMELIGNAT